MRVQAEIRLRHEIVLVARKKRGWSQAQLGEAAGISQGFVSDVERMQFRRSSVREAALKVAAALELLPEDVIPMDLEEDIVCNARVSREVNTAALLEYSDRLRSRLILPAPDVLTDPKELGQAVLQALDKLTHREREILNALFGLNGREQLTAAKLAYRWSVSVSRVGQIEQKALEKLRHLRDARLVEIFSGD